MASFQLGENLDVPELWKVALGSPAKLVFGRPAQARVRAARKTIQSVLDSGKVVYGVNTGFGALASVSVDAKDIPKLQRNLLLSHAVGVGDDLPWDEKRLALILRLHSLSKGYSGVRPQLIRWFMRLFELELFPRVPEKGSVGASGDLAPLAHLALPIIGAGEIATTNGNFIAAGRALRKVGLEPLELQAKEGLALINGCQISNAIGLVAIAQMRILSRTADVAAALSVESLLGSHVPFEARVVRLRPHTGATATAGNLRRLLLDSEINQHHEACSRVQDPYSFRCTPQVHGAAKDGLAFAVDALLLEADSATDNPQIFPGRDHVLSTGNFHGQPIAMAMDHAALAACSWGNISERRIATLNHPAMNNGLPAFLSPKPGLNSGLMMPQVTAAALSSENKLLAHPASADTIPTSADQEDHVSMACHAARKLRSIVENVQRIVAIELYCSAQAREFHSDMKAGAGVQAAYELIRESIPPLKNDRYLATELAQVYDMVRSGAIARAAEGAVGFLHA